MSYQVHDGIIVKDNWDNFGTFVADTVLEAVRHILETRGEFQEEYPGSVEKIRDALLRDDSKLAIVALDELDYTVSTTKIVTINPPMV